MSKGPGIFSDIGKKAKDLLTKDYLSDHKFSVSTCTESGVTLNRDKITFDDAGNIKNLVASTKVSDGENGVTKANGGAKNIDWNDFVESGKSSLCRGSTSTEISDESYCSSFSSSVNKPHKANDLRWEAIQAVRTKDGVLDISIFKLMKAYMRSSPLRKAALRALSKTLKVDEPNMLERLKWLYLL